MKVSPYGLFSVAILAGLAVALVRFFPADQTPPAPQTVAAKADDGPRGILWATYKAQVSARLKDPASARFSNVHYYDGGPVEVVCGSVNSKNGFGGYTGDQTFIYSGKAILQEDAAATEWPAIVKAYCRS